MQLRATRLTAIATAVRNRFSGAALNLRFDNTSALDPRITFGRTTNATLTNSAGLIANAPMNLLTFSEQFDNAAWLKQSTTVTANAVVAPDGTTTADKVLETAVTTPHSVYQGMPAVAGTRYTLSTYGKAAERRYLSLHLNNFSAGATFDLQTGTVVGTPILSGGATWSIVDVGNGWYRCSVSGTSAATATFNTFIAVGLTGTLNSNVSANESYAGNATSGIFIWGAQLEIGSTATTYNPTTVKNLLGFTEHFDNAAWTKSNAFVQTNLLTYSQDFDNAAWSKVNGTTVSPNVTTAPDGTLTADKLVSAASTNNFFIASGGALGGAGTYAFSIYAKAAEWGFIGLAVNGGGFTDRQYSIELATGAATALAGLGGTITFNSQAVGNGWVRVDFAASLTGAATFRFGPRQNSSGVNQVGDGTSGVFFWGAQLVQGASAGDYKATYAAAAAVGYTDIYGQPFARKLVEDTANTQHTLSLASAALPASTPVTMSVYAKAAGRQWLRLQPASGSQAWFDVQNGVLGTVQAGVAATITPLGDGWYRCSATTAYANQTNYLFLANANNATSYTGDGTSGIYIFGAQLSDSASVDPYVYQPVAAPTSTAYYGPRFDYDPVTLAPKGLLIEEQRTNLLLQSSQLQSTWTSATDVTFTGNNAVSPDGTTTATKMVEGTANSAHGGRYFSLSSGATGSVAFSLYIKAAERRYLYITDSYAVVSCYFDAVTGVIRNATAATFTATAVGNGWWRLSAKLTITNPYLSFQIWLNRTDTFVADVKDSYTGNGTSGIFIWGHQFESGAFSTSYIPTVASQATRAADVATMVGNNFARWYNQNAGTVYVEAAAAATGNYGTYSITSDDNNRFYSNVDFSSVQWVGATNGVIQASLPRGVFSPNVYFKHGAAFTTNDFATVINGGAALTDNTCAMPFVNRLFIGTTQTSSTFLNGTIKRIAYYNRRLANSELQSITA